MPRSIRRILMGFTLGALIAPVTAHAQTIDYAGQLNVPYGHAYRDENVPYVASTRDLNGNRIIVNGEIVQGDGSNLPGTLGVQGLLQQYGYGTSYGYSTAANSNDGTTQFNGGAAAIGNQLNVVTIGNWNTVIVNSTQTNNGNQTVNLNGQELNGEINLND